jgi:hypothetical protein
VDSENNYGQHVATNCTSKSFSSSKLMVSF